MSLDPQEILMTPTERSNALYRIFNGYLSINLDGTLYIIKYPGPDVLHEAEERYIDAMYELSFKEDWLNDNTARGLLLRLGIIKTNVDEAIKSLTEQADNAKLEMFNNYLNQTFITKTKVRLKLIQDKLNETYVNRHMLDYVTGAGFAQICKQYFLLFKTTFYSNNRRVWKKEEDMDYMVVDKLIDNINKQQLLMGDMREIARTEPWRSYWASNKETVFPKSVIEWSDEQRSLVSLSRMYDNIYASTDCPADEVIQDDDLLDGWMIHMKNKSTQEQKNKLADSLTGNKGGEWFIPVGDAEHAKRINDLNSPTAQAIKKQRSAIVQQRGAVQHAEFPDVQLERLNVINSK